MSNEIANQLLVRVQNEMAHNITTVKKQLIEWLERPESGGVDAFAEQLSEVSGGLALLNRNNAAQLCAVLADSVKTLDDKYRDKTVQESEFSEIGAEIASSLLLLNDYITRLSFIEPTDERLLNEAAQAIESILAGNGVAAITVQPKIDRETYQALSAKVTEVLETSRNQIEQYGVHANKQFDVTSVIGHNKNLISLFEVLDLKVPQLLLKQINQMLDEQLSESQWIDIAEAMILVEETLKHAQYEAEDVADYRSAITEQSAYSRSLEIQKLLRDTGEIARQFYESLRKSLTNIETVSTEQPWKEAALRTSHFASIAHLVGEKHLSAALNQLSLQFAEISLQTSANADAYPAAIDVLIAAEYIFNDLSDTAKINHSDVDYLKQVSDALNTFYKPSNQAKSLLLDFIKHEEKFEEAQVKNEDADLANGLDDLLDGLDALDSHFDGSLAEIEKDVESDQEEELPSAVAITGQANEDQAAAAAGAYQAYFAGKSLNELSTLSVPAGKENFLESHDSAVMDDEIREFFLEELAEKIQEIRDELEPWQANPYEQEHIGVVRRAFHTIKGSGRTVGYEALGECAWQHEQMLNRVIDKTFDVNATIQNLISDTVELLRILTVGEDFVEHQPALLMQASLAEHITNYLSEHKDADEQVLAQYANSVRAALTDDAKHAPQIIEKITGKLTAVEKQTPLSDLSSVESNIIGEATNTVATAATIPSSGDFSTVDEKSVSSDVSPKSDSVSDISFADENDLIRTAENSSVDAAAEKEPAQTFSLDFADTERSEEASTIADLSVHSNEKAGEDSGISLDVDTKAISDNVSQQTKGEDAFVERSVSSDISSISLDAAESEADFLADDISATVAQDQSSTLSGNVEHKEEIQAANTYAFGQPFYADKTLADLDNISSVGDKNVVSDQDQQAVDQDILEIFLEELDTTVEQIDQTLSQWKSAPQDKGLVEEVRRAFHTIKGSGKMVGYQDLGDFAWQYEHLLNSIAESYFPTNDLVLNAVADANDLLKILRTEDGFNEHKASLSLQGQVAHQAREHLMASPEMSSAEQADLARNLYAQFAAKSDSAETVSQDAVHADLQIDKVTAAEEDTVSQTALHADVDLFADDQHSISQPIDANISTSIDDFSGEQQGSQSSTVSVTQTLESAAVASPQSVAQKTQALDDAFEPAATEQKVVSSAAYDEAIVEKLAKEVSAVIGHGLHSIDIHDEDDKSLLRDMVSARISQQEHSLSSEQMASLSAQVSAQLAGKVPIGDLSEILPASALDAQDSAAPTISASVSHIVASPEAVAYRHIADMLQRSLAAQPLDEDDEAILAQQLDKEFSRLGHSLDDVKERAELQAQLSAAFSGSAADNPAYEKLLSNVLSKAAENALSDDNVRLDDAVMQRLVATVSRMSDMQTDSDDVEILREQIQAAIAKHTADVAQQEVLEASVAIALKENFAQESAASALLDEVFADEDDSASIQTSAATDLAENVIEDKLLNTEVPLASSVEESQAVSFSETEESNDAITDFFADADNAEAQFASPVESSHVAPSTDASLSSDEQGSSDAITEFFADADNAEAQFASPVESSHVAPSTDAVLSSGEQGSSDAITDFFADADNAEAQFASPVESSHVAPSADASLSSDEQGSSDAITDFFADADNAEAQFASPVESSHVAPSADAALSSGEQGSSDAITEFFADADNAKAQFASPVESSHIAPSADAALSSGEQGSSDAIAEFFADADNNAEVQFADSVAENEAHEMVDALISEIESQSEVSVTDEVNAGLSKDDKQDAVSVNEMDADDKALMDEMLRNVAQELAAEPAGFSDTANETSFDDMLQNSAESHDEIASSSAEHISAGQNVTRAKADKVDYVDSRSGDIVFNSSASSATGIAGMTPSLSSANAPKANAHSVSRLSDELSKISAHPSLENAVGAKESEQHQSSGLGKFLNAVDKFESLSQQVEDNSTPEMLDNLIESVYDIEDSIEAGSVPDWIWRMLDAIEQLLLAHRNQGSGISLSAASILRQSIDLIENFDDDNSAEDAIQTINSLMQTRQELGISNTHMTREIAPIATSAPVSQNWDEWIPDPNHGTELAETFLDEAVLLLGRSQLEAERWDQNRGSITHLDAIRRDMHTLKGGARMSGYLALGDLTHAIESMIESLVDGHSEANNQAVAVLSGALWQAMIMLDAVRDGFLPQTDPYMLNNINRFLNLPLPYPEVAEQELRLREAQAEEELSKENAASMQEAAVSAAEEIHEAEEMATAFDENIDPILVDIFTDEAQELIDQAEALFAQDLKNEAVVEELKRNMHTLKGAARLVGLTAIGDTSHLMESLIEQLADYNETKMRQAKNLLNMGHEALYGMLDSVLRKEMPIPAKSLNESLTIFAKEGRFVQPNAEAPAAAVESVTSDETPVAKQAQAEQHLPVQVSDVASSAAVEQAQDAAPSASPENDVKAEKPAESPQESAQKDAASSSIAKEAAPDPSITQEADKPQAAQEESHAAEAEKPETPKPISSAPEAAKSDTAPAGVQRYVRVDADLLDEMIAMVGETAIMRSRLENVSSESTFNLNELTRIANRIDEQMRRLDNETEAQMLFRREAQTNDDEHFDPLEMDRFTEIQQLSRQLSEAINDLKNVQETLAHENALIRNISIQQGFIQRGIQDRLLTTQLLRFDVNEARLKRLVRQTAKSVDKDIELIIEGGHVELERRLIEEVLPAIEHMIRNSVGHGIETPAERKAAGKPAQGIVKLTVAAKSSNVEIRILDDGRGFDYDRIREKARSKGWLDESRAQDQHYLNTLMMRSGFSTAQAVTQLSGRGVGMDVVNEMVKQRRGQLIAESIPGKGAQFTILMPFTMSISEVLLVEVAEQTYAVPMNTVAAIAQVPREDLQRSHAGEEVYIQYDGMDYRLYMLGDYFKSDEYQFAIDSATAPALFINASGEPTAFYVDRVANRVEVIVKNVNRQVLNIPGISGATILGDGNVIPVLEPLDLARRIGSLSQYHSSASAEEAFVPNILVVDDSVTMRKVSTRLLERNGYIVESAKDGLDAIDVLQRFTPDLILLDIEMPRMDGFEFASHVRQNSQVSEVPIIMITSRTGDKHRERADQIGIQDYLGKPYREDILIETIESLLGDKAND